MHLFLAGEFLNIWLDNRSDNGFLANYKGGMDEAMLNVKFPHDFNRKLRPVGELKRWKDRELQNLLLHASLPNMKLFFANDLLCHFSILVTAIYPYENSAYSKYVFFL